MQSRFAAYAGDCRISGTLVAASRTMDEALEGDAPLTLRDAVLERLGDGRSAAADHVDVFPADLLAVEARPRRRTGVHVRAGRRVHVQAGPYAVIGELVDPGKGDAHRMLAVTGASISWVRAGQVEMRQVDALLVNRALVDWVVDGGGRNATYVAAFQATPLPG